MDKQDIWLKWATYCFMIPLAGVCLVNGLFSIFTSTYFPLHMESETPHYQQDVWPLVFLGMILWTALIFLSSWSIGKAGIKEKYIRFSVCLWGAVVCLCAIFIFRCQAGADGWNVSEAAMQCMMGNYECLQSEYFIAYPFQIGMLAFFELVYRLFGTENFIAFQLLNVLSITIIIDLLPRFADLLFGDKEVANLTAIGSALLFPLFLYSTFIYGDIPGFALGALSIYYGLRYLQEGRVRDALLTGMFFLIGLPIKGNNLIFVVAIMIGILFKGLQEKNGRRIFGLAIILLFSQLGSGMIEEVYAKRAGVEGFSQGTPKLAWVAMGLQEAKESDNGCGWYNGYNVRVYQQSGQDYELAKERSLESIRQSLYRFVEKPKEAIDYFYRKFTSQWNDPTYQAQMMNEWYSRKVEYPTALSLFFTYEKGRSILFAIMNTIHPLIFLFSGLGVILWIKQWSMEKAYYLLNIFGGMIFHTLIWEAKGRYVLPYYVLLVPVAASGMQWAFAAMAKKCKSRN